MIELSKQAIFLQQPDGSAVLFDHDYFMKRIRNVLPEDCEDPDSLTNDAVNAVEYALRHDINNCHHTPFYVDASAVDALFVKILQSIGMYEAAADFMRAEIPPQIPQDELIASLLRDNIQGIEPKLDSIVRKISNTLQSIGANAYGQEQLVLELGRHFLSVSASADKLTLRLPKNTHDDAYMIAVPEFTQQISQSAGELIAMRIVRLHSIDLRIFPSLYVEIFLFPIFRSRHWDIPVTELMVQPVFRVLADCIDQLCIAADKACARHDADAVIPVKLILHFGDILTFVSDVMGCVGEKAIAQTTEELIAFLTVQITRRPDKITCL